ncbi:MAG TPA: hypothetical protein VLF67_03815 [Candidatus Saccharimonas sp.]|nr:hypothetical protein [Candidatus Saccharimonas sp.]
MDFSHILMLASTAGDIINHSASQACGSSCSTVTLGQLFKQITDALIFVIGSISVLMIIIGGLRYVISNGDAKAAEAGRNTVLYAVIGLILSIAAFAIVSFVSTTF